MMAAAELYYTHNESGHAGVQTRAWPVLAHSS